MSKLADNNQKLRPGYQPKQMSTVRGKRTHYVNSVVKREAGPNDEYRVTISKLGKTDVIYMDTAKLSFTFENSNDKSWFVNNLGKQLMKDVTVLYDKGIIYRSENDNVIETYMDLWKSDKQRRAMAEFRVASEATRKVWSGDDGAPTSGNDSVIADKNKTLAIPLTKVFGGVGPICTYGMKEIEFVIKLPKSEEIMVAQSGEEKGQYKIKDINLEFEMVEGMDISSQTTALFNRGRHIYYDYPKWLNKIEWAKDSTIQTFSVNIPLKWICGLVLLFKEKGQENTGVFADPKITGAKVSIEGVPLQVYNNYGIRESDIYKEAPRFFGSPDYPDANLEVEEFYSGKTAFVIDFRTVPEKDVVDTGRKLVGTQAGLLLEITKEATAKDLVVYPYAIADASLYISSMETKLNVAR